MTRRRRARRGRPYQPLPVRRGPRFGAVIIVAVALLLVLGAVAVALGR